MSCTLGEKCLCPHVEHNEDECFDADFMENYTADIAAEMVDSDVKKRIVENWIRKAITSASRQEWLLECLEETAP